MLDPSGYDAGKKAVGRKRHILPDTHGLLLGVLIHPASVQAVLGDSEAASLRESRNGAEALPTQARRQFPFIERVIGNAGYQGPKMLATVPKTGPWTLEIVRRCDKHRFVVPPKRWIFKRRLAWIGRHGRLARDYERHMRIATAYVRLAMIRLMRRR